MIYTREEVSQEFKEFVNDLLKTMHSSYGDRSIKMTTEPVW